MNIQAQSSNNDFVQVQLTAEGIAASKGLPVAVHGASVELNFVGSAPVNVHRAVWAQTLRTIAPFGKPWFQIVPPQTASTAAASTASAPVAKLEQGAASKPEPIPMPAKVAAPAAAPAPAATAATPAPAPASAATPEPVKPATAPVAAATTTSAK